MNSFSRQDESGWNGKKVRKDWSKMNWINSNLRLTVNACNYWSTMSNSDFHFSLFLFVLCPSWSSFLALTSWLANYIYIYFSCHFQSSVIVLVSSVGYQSCNQDEHADGNDGNEQNSVQHYSSLTPCWPIILFIIASISQSIYFYSFPLHGRA